MIEKTISKFMKRQLEEQKRSKRKEKRQVCIKPDSYIGKEIQYQTALLHEILEEIRKTNKGKRFNQTINVGQLSAEDVRRECKNASVAEKESGLYEKAKKFAEKLMDKPTIVPNEVAVLSQLLEVLLRYGEKGES